MDLRGSSTTVDAVLFVLLVGVAVATLAGVDSSEPGGPERVADETADVLATSTTQVNFTRSGRIVEDGETHAVTVDRRAHGTYAELLAAAAVSDPTVGARSLTGSGSDMREQIASATIRALPTRSANVEVRASWRPYSGGEHGRTVTAGEKPPRDADVSIATITVPSGFPNVSARLEPRNASYETVARAISRGMVAGSFPLDETTDALASEGPDRAIVASRYRTAFQAVSASPGDTLRRGDAAAANGRLTDELTPTIRAELTAEFDSAEAAARAVAVDEVRIVVRTWSP